MARSRWTARRSRPELATGAPTEAVSAGPGIAAGWRGERESMTRRVLIVGGVAGGASCAARLRRLDESAEIVVFDRGPYVSFANCGLPYYVGNVIADERELLVATGDSSASASTSRSTRDTRSPRSIARRGRSRCAISPTAASAGSATTRSCSSPGAAPIRPPLPGIDLPGVFAVRSIPDSRRIRAWIAERSARTARRRRRRLHRPGDGREPRPSRPRRHRAGEAAAGDAAARSRDGGADHGASRASRA